MTEETRQPRQLKCGPILIEWHWSVLRPIAVDHEMLNGSMAFITETAVNFRHTGIHMAITVPKEYQFDGASIPRIFWAVPGFAPIGRHLWAALLHDWLCDESAAGRFDREVADAIFSALLRHTKVPFWRGRAMALAVHAFRYYMLWKMKK